ncbi:MAG: hypothetical protein LUG46_04355 [Erysipelotrichaceae bacterium]|nr:hypothetical protein [Erysipelotrichaceae bacterium]
MNNTFKIVITIKNNEVSGKIIELELNEEFINHKIYKMQGEFVTQIRDTYNQVLLDIRNHCFIKETFLFPQANRLEQYTLKTYHNNPEFPWTKDPYDALFRNSKTKQWYCLIINRNDKEIINL